MDESSGQNDFGGSGDLPEYLARQRSKILSSVVSTIEAAQTYDDLLPALNLLPATPRKVSKLFAVRPELALAAAESSGVPAEELEVYTSLGSAIRDLAGSDEIERLTREVTELVEADANRFDDLVDPFQNLTARTQLDVLGKSLAIRVVAYQDDGSVEADFTKPMIEIVALAVDFLRWAVEALDETKAVGLDPADFVNTDGLGHIAAKAEEYTRLLRANQPAES